MTGNIIDILQASLDEFCKRKCKEPIVWKEFGKERMKEACSDCPFLKIFKESDDV